MAVVTRVRLDARSVWAGTLGSPLVKGVFVAALLLVVVADAGSVLMTKMSLSDTGRAAGRSASMAAAGMPLTTTTAVTAYQAAERVTSFKDGVSIQESDFEVLPDGGVMLTVVKTAPSLVLGRVPWLARFAVVSMSVVVGKAVT